MAASPTVLAVPQHDKSRYDAICRTFEAKYGKKPVFFARAPGRVNLIGEHIDYCGYGVLPMAVEQDIVIAVAPNDTNSIRLANTDGSFEPFSSKCGLADVVIDKGNPRWQHYFLCGYRGILEHFGLSECVGLDLVLDGTVPRSAGLSSSSACVCCAALVTMHANNKQLTKLQLAELCQHCERYIGTEGGGMDQSISFLAQPGTAKYIEFNPIRATDVQLPQGATFVVSNSCVPMNKAATVHFNCRVAECRLATQVLAKSKGLDWKQVKKLGDLQNDLGVTLEDMLQLVKETLHTEPYSKQEVCSILGVDPEQLNTLGLSEKSLHLESFKLHDRALHVYSEAKRVLDFKAVCDNYKADAMEKLGQLMNDSHTSCSQQYECSCEELDKLTHLARQSGALGSRLTGAGWGGCAVSLVPTDRLDSFLQLMHDGYYSDPSRSSEVKSSLFATQPGGGAVIYSL